jgi:hypothetical protein
MCSDLTAVHPRERSADRQTQAEAAVLASGRTISLAEALEEVREK